MKVFNGRSATDEYMSTHSLTFSTPEMTLKKFALWLGDQVTNPDGSKKHPRLLLYIEDIDDEDDMQFARINPNVDDSFKPSGAVTEMYGLHSESDKPNLRHPTSNIGASSKDNLDIQSVRNRTETQERRYCNHCGNPIGTNAKFC